MKIFARDHNFAHVYQKSQSYDVPFPRYGVRQADYLSFWAIFCPFSHLTTRKIILRYGVQQTKIFLDLFLPFYPSLWENQDFGKMNNTLEDIIILQMCTINDSHDVWFLRYEMQQTKFLVILDHFLPFYHTNNPKNQYFEELKKTTRRYYHFTHVYHK